MAFQEKEDRPVTALLSDLFQESSTLVRQEIRLARAEISEKVSQVGNGVISLVAGGLIAFAALLILLMAVVAGLSEVLDISAGWSALIVGVITAIIAFILVQKGMSDLKASSLSPDRTVESLR